MKSMLSRMTALVVAICVLSFALHIWLATLWVQPMLDDFVHILGSQARTTKKLLESTQPEIRNEVAAGMQTLRLVVYPIEVEDPSAAFVGGPSTIKEVREKLQQMVGPDVRVLTPASLNNSDRVAFLFEFAIDKVQWRMSFEVKPPIAVVLGSIFGWLAVLTLAIGAATLLGMRWIATPLRSLENQIGTQGPHLAPLSMPKHASQEIETLVSGFNALAIEIQATDVKRLQMLAGLSHDLRTPLTRLSLRVETELEGGVAASISDALLHDIAAMQKIVGQFMAYVQGNNKSALGVEDSVPDVIRNTLIAYPHTVCAMDIHSQLADLRLPDVAVRRILTNLIDNAFTYGSRPVEVILGRHQPHRGVRAQWMLAVMDHGTGLSAEQFSQALQPFIRLDETTNEVGHCGLGLAIVEQLALQLGGRLERVPKSSPSAAFGVAFIWGSAQ